MRSRLENREVESSESVRERSWMCTTRDLSSVLGGIHRDGEEHLLCHASSAIDLSPPRWVRWRRFSVAATFLASVCLVIK
jgi:hypothetical protein